MKLALPVGGIAAAVLVLLPHSSPALAPPAGDSPFSREPVLVVDQAGNGGSAMTIVYDDGRVLHAREGLAPFGIPDDMVTVQLEPDVVDALVRGLLDAGALDATDFVTNELLVTTLTLMRGSPSSESRTFSYQGFPAAAYPAIDATVQGFLEEHVLPLLAGPQ